MYKLGIKAVWSHTASSAKLPPTNSFLLYSKQTFWFHAFKTILS